MFLKVCLSAALALGMTLPARAEQSFQSHYPQAQLPAATVAKPAEFPAVVDRIGSRLAAPRFSVYQGPYAVDYTWRGARLSAALLVFDSKTPTPGTRKVGQQYQSIVTVDEHTVVRAIAPGKRRAVSAARLVARNATGVPKAIDRHVKAHATQLLAWFLVTRLNVAPVVPQTLPPNPIDLLSGLSYRGYDLLGHVGFGYYAPGCLGLLPRGGTTSPELHVTLQTIGVPRVLGIDLGPCSDPTETAVGFDLSPQGPPAAERVAARLTAATGTAVTFGPWDATYRVHGATATTFSWGSRRVSAERVEYSKPVAGRVLAEKGRSATGPRFAELYAAPSPTVLLSVSAQGPSALARARKALRALRASGGVITASERYSRKYATELIAQQLIERGRVQGLQDYPAGVADYLRMVPASPSPASAWAYASVAAQGACVQVSATEGDSRPIRMLLDERPGGFSGVLDASYGVC